MPRIDFIVTVLAVSIPLVALAKRINVGYPVVLVLGGLVLGFIPSPRHPEIDPNLILLAFLPPLLYWQAVTAPTGTMRSNLRALGSLAVGLVVVTAAAVSVIAHAIVPGLSWPAAIVLGAIVAPTDDVAFWSVAQRLRLPRRIIVMIGGEALLNDAPSLLLYGIAVAAAVSGTFSPGVEALRLLWVVPCSVGIGLLAGRAVSLVWKYVRDPQLQTLTALVAPYLAYLPAAQLGLSGVLAVVTAAIWINRSAHSVLRPEARQHGTAFWDTTVFVINAVMFVLIGFHLHDALPTLGHYPPAVLVGSVVAVNAAVIGLRFAWIFAGFVSGDWRSRTITAWAGLRGGVSLAAALALPKAVAGGAPFAHRDLIILVAFSVILVTLVGQGLSLPWLVERVRPRADVAEEREELHAYAAMRDAALQHVHALESAGRIVPGHAQQLRAWYAHRVQAPDVARELVGVERASLIEARERGLIDNTVMRRAQASLDMEEIQLDRLRPAAAYAASISEPPRQQRS
jgi:CPA1 family monovalent cation:H+ antiporter